MFSDSHKVKLVSSKTIVCIVCIPPHLSNRKLDGIKSLVELFEYHIKGIIAENIDFEEEVLDYRQSVGIYVGGSSINQINFIPNLNKLLECVMGDLFFRVSIVYKRGVPNLSLILL